MTENTLDGMPTPAEREPDPVDPFRFGVHVHFEHVLSRVLELDHRSSKHDPAHKIMHHLKLWKVRPSTDRQGDGILIGKRTLVNGERDFLGYDEGVAFRRGESFSAWLVAYDMQRNPVYVLPEHLTLLEKE